MYYYNLLGKSPLDLSCFFFFFFVVVFFLVLPMKNSIRSSLEFKIELTSIDTTTE